MPRYEAELTNSNISPSMWMGCRVVVHEVSKVVFAALTLRPTRAEASVSFFSMTINSGRDFATSAMSSAYSRCARRSPSMFRRHVF